MSNDAFAATTAANGSGGVGGGRSSNYFLHNLSNLGFGYSIAVSLGFHVLLSASSLLPTSTATPLEIERMVWLLLEDDGDIGVANTADEGNHDDKATTAT
ncbi:hypothetical protein HHK36_028517 [Tetracentron sinense]|uniref:Uncharacterized protein n=1 Tax=Tetracentron sinense TaxID=13715 RepID=A0A834YB69_TETSI|nr:hypothetical protein HHK36_028517 [Tetracentron sinense]